MARVIVNCGVVPIQQGEQADGVITFGKHAGQKLGDESISFRYLAWVYAWLENNSLPPSLVHVLELVWYWGDRKCSEAQQGDDREFDEYVDEARLGMDEAFKEESEAKRLQGFQMTYDYDPDRDNWGVVSLREKRVRDKERAREKAGKVVAEAVGGNG